MDYHDIEDNLSKNPMILFDTSALKKKGETRVNEIMRSLAGKRNNKLNKLPLDTSSTMQNVLDRQYKNRKGKYIFK